MIYEVYLTGLWALGWGYKGARVPGQTRVTFTQAVIYTVLTFALTSERQRARGDRYTVFEHRETHSMQLGAASTAHSMRNPKIHACDALTVCYVTPLDLPY